MPRLPYLHCERTSETRGGGLYKGAGLCRVMDTFNHRAMCDESQWPTLFSRLLCKWAYTLCGTLQVFYFVGSSRDMQHRWNQSHSSFVSATIQMETDQEIEISSAAKSSAASTDF